METAIFYGYDNVDFYGPLLGSGCFEETNPGNDPRIELVAENEEDLKEAMVEIHKVAQALGLSLDDTYLKLNNLWEGGDETIWTVYGEEIGERVQEYFHSLFEE